MSNEIAIIRRENVDMIVSSAPTAFSENQVSHQRCLAAGQTLLEKIHEQGMTDEFDKEASIFIEKARKTVAKMNEKRSPVTKLFDEIRRQFTTIENDVDPTKKGSIPYQLQQLRNQYAAQKREEENRKRRALIEQQERAQARSRFLSDFEARCRSVFNDKLNDSINTLYHTFSLTTLANYDESLQSIQNYSDAADLAYLSNVYVILPPGFPIEEEKAHKQKVWDKLIPELTAKYAAEISQRKQDYIMLMPSKKSELERAAKASAEEAERIRREMQEREAAEAARKEAERKEQEAREAQAQQLRQQQEEMNGLFAASAASVEAYQPKTSVKKKITLLNPEGVLPVLMMWWQEEGCTLSVDELSKIFKKQLSFCEKLANAKEGARLIEDESVCYEDDVKAK